MGRPCARSAAGANVCGNARAESFRARFKTDGIDRREWPVFANLADAADYFDYCNHQRLHSSLGYQVLYLMYR